MKQVQQMY